MGALEQMSPETIGLESQQGPWEPVIGGAHGPSL